MKYLLYSIVCMHIVISGCEPAETISREFSIIRTAPISDIDSSGATFHGELVKKGNAQTASYGFVWSVEDPSIGESDSVVLGQDLISETFEARIDYALSAGTIYQVRAFATLDGQTVYGNVEVFASEGSSDSPWSLTMRAVDMEGWFDAFGLSDDTNGYILFQSAHMYVFDPNIPSIAPTTKFPVRGNSGSHFADVNLENSSYVFCDIDDALYKYETNTWTFQSVFPFYTQLFGGYFQAFASAEQVYILSSYKSYAYSPSTGMWESKATVPNQLGYSIAGTANTENAYVMTSEKTIWKYNAVADAWDSITVFPGDLGDTIIGFTHGSKIYFGLSLDRGIWAYNLLSHEWKLSELLPIDLPEGGKTSFSLDGFEYIVLYNNGMHDIWRFDPSKG